MEETAQAVVLFFLHHAQWPEDLRDLVRMPEYVKPDTWPKGGYLLRYPLDGWGGEFIYRVPGTEGASYDIVSLGQDGRVGGAGPAKDISIHD